MQASIRGPRAALVQARLRVPATPLRTPCPWTVTALAVSLAALAACGDDRQAAGPTEAALTSPREASTAAGTPAAQPVPAGLSAGERLVVRGQQKLIGGNPVVVREENVQLPEPLIP